MAILACQKNTGCIVKFRKIWGSDVRTPILRSSHKKPPTGPPPLLNSWLRLRTAVFRHNRRLCNVSEMRAACQSRYRGVNHRYFSRTHKTVIVSQLYLSPPSAPWPNRSLPSSQSRRWHYMGLRGIHSKRLQDSEYTLHAKRNIYTRNQLWLGCRAILHNWSLRCRVQGTCL